jgi:hypothetical protein
MLFALLLATFIISFIVSFLVVQFFNKPVGAILGRIIAGELSSAWQKYLTFAIYVVGISGGVRIWELERYITPQTEGGQTVVLNAERWTLEIYRTIIGTLQSIAWMLLVFFVFSLIAFVIVRAFELKHGNGPQK